MGLGSRAQEPQGRSTASQLLWNIVSSVGACAGTQLVSGCHLHPIPNLAGQKRETETNLNQILCGSGLPDRLDPSSILTAHGSSAFKGWITIISMLYKDLVDHTPLAFPSKAKQIHAAGVSMRVAFRREYEIRQQGGVFSVPVTPPLTPPQTIPGRRGPRTTR